MTRPINLCMLSYAASSLDESDFCKYDKQISSRTGTLKYDRDELHSVIALIHILQTCSQMSFSDFNGFAYAFRIPRVSAEFDLLKITDRLCLNIEIKSRTCPLDRIEKQLRRNRHYLGHLAVEAECFSFVASEKTLYKLEGESVRKTSIEQLADTMRQLDSPFLDDLDSKFKPSDYLISPLFDTQAFLHGLYFLNDQQEDYKKELLTDLRRNAKGYSGVITGLPGTGKSLLLYDVALSYSREKRKPVCIVHCGALQNEHHAFNRAQENIHIYNPIEFFRLPFEKYAAVFFDEMQRLYAGQFDPFFDLIEQHDLPVIACVDPNQILSFSESRSDIMGKLKNRAGIIHEKILNTKVRTNPEVAAFIKGFNNLNDAVKGSLKDKVHIYYADSFDEAKCIVTELQEQAFQLVRLSDSLYYKSELDKWKLQNARSSHGVVGLEFDKVVIAIGSYIEYQDNGTFYVQAHPNPDYLYSKLLFQAMTRAKEELAVVIYSNKVFFERLLNAFF